MKRILITGGRGFLGRNLAAHLGVRDDCEVVVAGRERGSREMGIEAAKADLIFHLAGVNRASQADDFEAGNAQLTETLCRAIDQGGRAPRIVFSSTIQAGLGSPYGASKARAEETLRRFAATSGAEVRIYRLKNLFGKWCRPNYNSVTATFCHNVANDLPISVLHPEQELDLTYVDDVMSAFLTEIDGAQSADLAGELSSHRIRLGELAQKIKSFHEIPRTLTIPDFADWFERALYATYLSYLPADGRRHRLQVSADARGQLAEFAKQGHFGQIFVSRTRPGFTRGNHYHHSKTEKFLVLEGEGLIRMSPIEGGAVVEYPVSGGDWQVIDIPPGFTHSITNTGGTEMVTLFLASEVFDLQNPDTRLLSVGDELRATHAYAEGR